MFKLYSAFIIFIVNLYYYTIIYYKVSLFQNFNDCGFSSQALWKVKLKIYLQRLSSKSTKVHREKNVSSKDWWKDGEGIILTHRPQMRKRWQQQQQQQQLQLQKQQQQEYSQEAPQITKLLRNIHAQSCLSCQEREKKERNRERER